MVRNKVWNTFLRITTEVKVHFSVSIGTDFSSRSLTLLPRPEDWWLRWYDEMENSRFHVLEGTRSLYQWHVSDRVSYTSLSWTIVHLPISSLLFPFCTESLFNFLITFCSFTLVITEESFDWQPFLLIVKSDVYKGLVKTDLWNLVNYWYDICRVCLSRPTSDPFTPRTDRSCPSDWVSELRESFRDTGIQRIGESWSPRSDRWLVGKTLP